CTVRSWRRRIRLSGRFPYRPTPRLFLRATTYTTYMLRRPPAHPARHRLPPHRNQQSAGGLSDPLDPDCGTGIRPVPSDPRMPDPRGDRQKKSIAPDRYCAWPPQSQHRILVHVVILTSASLLLDHSQHHAHRGQHHSDRERRQHHDFHADHFFLPFDRLRRRMTWPARALTRGIFLRAQEGRGGSVVTPPHNHAKESPAKKAGPRCENEAAITDFWLVLFSAGQANRCRRRLEAREDRHLPEDREHPEHHLDCSRPGSRPEPMQRSSPARRSKRQERANRPKSSVLWMRFAEAWTQSVVAVRAVKANGVQHSAALRRKPADHLRGRRRPADSRSERAILDATSEDLSPAYRQRGDRPSNSAA